MLKANTTNKIIVVRTALVGKADTVPALLRAPGTNPKTSGRWELPGGKVDAGEELADALHRELEEETGLKVEQISPFKLYDSYVIGDGDKAGIPYEAFCCRAVAIGGSLRLSDEHVAIQQYSPAYMMQAPQFRPDTPLLISQLF